MKWKKDKGKQGRKVIDIEKATGKGIPKDRFIRYPVMKVINMWCLFDTKTNIQHYILKENAEERILSILKKEESNG